MQEITVASGYKEFKINGKATVWLNPTDTNFIERYFNAFEAVDAMQETYQERTQKAEGREVFDVAREIDADIREQLNGLFDSDVCGELFGTMHVIAVAEGLPVWANLLFAFLDLIDDTIVAEKKKTNPRLEAYVKKYKRK